MKQKLVIIGNGMAALRALETLLKEAPNKFEVTIFGKEPYVNYNRIMLSPVLAKEKTFEDIIINDQAWYDEHEITLHTDDPIVKINKEDKCVTSNKNVTEHYDLLWIATGSNPFIIPIPGNDLEGVISFRDMHDVNYMLKSAQNKKNAIVIGGGLLGLEAAHGLKLNGMNVTVIHLGENLMDRQLDASAAYLLKEELEGRDINVRTSANTKAILGKNHIEAIKLDDGTIIDADLVVMATGIKPNIEIAQSAGLECNRGIIIDDQLKTSDPHIYAIGECAEHRGICYGLVAPLYEAGKIMAKNIAKDRNDAYQGSITNTKLKVSGVNVFSAGDFSERDENNEIVYRDAISKIYKRLILKDNRLIGAVLYGDTEDGAFYFNLIKSGDDVSIMQDRLIFSQNIAQNDNLPNPQNAVTALADDAEICGCNGVCKKDIVDEINEHGLTNLQDVQARTKASASCGSCKGLVEQLLEATIGDAFQAQKQDAICPCTDLGHGDVRRLIIADQIKTIPELMQKLEWKTSCGCAKCRPALNYYLICAWPHEYQDDYQSRFINERVHANIQKDGTYSIVPRMWGGVTSSSELRAIADAVDKYDIPMVKCTGGQRIDMLGIKKEDLPNVWADLGEAGFVSGHAYAKGLRTVKTCVGSEWCRFGTQNSTALGVWLEKFMWGSWTPAKLKLAVSGCPRNCAEATCKDIGIVCVDSGFDIHFAGAAGLDIKPTEILGHVKTEKEVVEHVVALTQMYREQAYYLERIYKWAKRIGLDEIRSQIMDQKEKRETYFKNFVHSQKYAQVDPWDERVSGKDKHEFNPLKTLDSLEVAE